MFRSNLYVPGSDPHKIEKALASDADAITLDLEDSVAVVEKERAREVVVETLRIKPKKPVFVRINPLGSEWGRRDVEALGDVNPDYIRLPKTETPEQVNDLARLLDLLHCDAVLVCAIETALGLERCLAIATAHRRVASIGLGEADLRADLGVEGDAGLLYARSRIVTAARAARLPRPAQSVYPNVKDLDGLRTACDYGRRLGFQGRMALHPVQVPIINSAFMPSSAEIRVAREIVRQSEQRALDGVGAFTLANGDFVDEAIVKSARRTLFLE